LFRRQSGNQSIAVWLTVLRHLTISVEVKLEMYYFRAGET
jgi:hypothetical protein